MIVAEGPQEDGDVNTKPLDQLESKRLMLREEGTFRGSRGWKGHSYRWPARRASSLSNAPVTSATAASYLPRPRHSRRGGVDGDTAGCEIWPDSLNRSNGDHVLKLAG